MELLPFPGLARAVPGLTQAVVAALDLRDAAARRHVARSLGFDHLVVAHQVHGRKVLHPRPGQTEAGRGDVLLVDEPGVLAAVFGADCPLALLVAPVQRALALVQSGWRGTAAGALGAAIDALEARAGAAPASLRLGLGPGIGPDRYEVGAEVVAALGSGAAPFVRAREGDRFDVDLRGILRRQALDAGVPASGIETLGVCTYDEPSRYFSVRRDGPGTGRHALVAGWSS